MKKTAVLICMLAGSLYAVQAQLSDRLLPHMGFMYEIIDLSEGEIVGGLPSQGLDFSRPFYTFNLGAYVALWHAQDIVSVGIDPSVHFGINFEANPAGTNTGILYIVQTPVFAMGRFGINSTPYNDQGFGMGAGIGANYTFFKRGVTNRKLSAVNPAAVFEISFRSGGGSITGRLHIPLAKPRAVYKYTGTGQVSDYEYTYNNWGIGIIYAL
ncbi:MAG: hypothetical protein D6730_15010 [Bacteroidetes bacterium]|nr:MAG: hypothetical protein D6730_15010 [Bacteroidota bacterium]